MTTRRDEVLDDLVALFLAEGFAELGVGDLAARLRCSRSTLYLVAPSKELIVRAAVRAFFRGAAERIEERVAAEPDLARRLEVYLRAVADELAPAGAQFHTDLAAHPTAAETYRENTLAAARRVGSLVEDAVAHGAMRPVDVGFVGTAVSVLMTAIQSGDVGERTGLDDAHAYQALADLLVRGLLDR